MKTLRMNIVAMLLLLVGMYPVFAQSGEKVTFVTSDDVVITGTLWNAGSGKAAVICLHQWRSDRSSFSGLASVLNNAGMTVLAIDARGYGDSKTTSKGSSVRPDRDIQKDIDAAFAFLKKTTSPKSIGLVGASYGSSNAVIYAARSHQVAALVLLSPGLNYFNALPTIAPIKKLTSRNILAFASSEDLRSVEAVEEYAKLLGKNITYKIYNNAGHGTDMLDAEKEIANEIKGFFSKHL